MALRDSATRFRAALGALLPVCLVWAQIATLAHALTTYHVLCPEHGKLVHVSPYVLAATASQPGGMDSGEGRADHGHHHCFLGLYASFTAVASTAPVEAGVAVHARALPTAGRSGCSQLPLLLLAPKCSPPAVA